MVPESVAAALSACAKLQGLRQQQKKKLNLPENCPARPASLVAGKLVGSFE